MANLVYKRITSTNLKVAGILDTDEMTIDVNGEIRKLATLLSNFNGAEIEFQLKIKDEEELDIPCEEFDM